MNTCEELLALKLFNIGAVDCENYHSLSSHRDNDNSTPSPIYFNLRTPTNPKPGPLDCDAMEMIGDAMADSMDQFHRMLKFDLIAGIPNAGIPIAAAFNQAFITRGLGSRSCLKLEKKIVNGKQRLSLMASGNPSFDVGQSILLIDDLVTKAGTGFKAIHALEKAGRLKVAGICVLIDRQQGGREQLEAAGYPVMAVYTIKELLELYLQRGCIRSDKYNEITTYLKG